MSRYDYTGVIHIHSEYSFDGRIPVEEIIEAASSNKIDFLMLTDHSTQKARDKGFEGWHGKTLLIVGQEISPRFNHYLAFKTKSAVNVEKDTEGRNPQVYINQVKEQGGMGFIAHPDHKGAPMFHVKHYPWTDWGVTGYTGIGVWDFMTDWQSSLVSYRHSLFSYLFPALFLRGPRPETLQRWDEMNQKGRVVGIAECDNHDTLRKWGPFSLSIFPFKRAFKFLRTHLLTETPLERNKDKDIELLLSALQKGRAYLAQEYFETAKGFSFYVQEGNAVAQMGDELTLQRSALIDVRLPHRAKVIVIRNGNIFYQDITDRLLYETKEHGIYRIEVFLKTVGVYRPWIFSNPIYIQKT